MLKKILLAGSMIVISAPVNAAVYDWAANAARLSAAIANMPDRFDEDTVLYNATCDRLDIMLSVFADEIDSLTTVFTCLREKYASLLVNYNKVLADTEVSKEDAARAKLLLEGELYELLRDTDARIATLTAERDALIVERDEIRATYDEMVGDSEAAAADVISKIRTLSDSYDVMVAAEDRMIGKLNTFKYDIETMFAVLDGQATGASNEICN